MHNNFPMREWHVTHMEKTLVKYVAGLAPDASAWEKRNHKKYGKIQNICSQIDYDIKHGVTSDQVILFLRKVRNDKLFSTVRLGDGSMGRLEEIEEYFGRPHRPLR